MFSTKTGASKLLIGVVIGLIVIKVVVSWLTGSISILAQATDSLLDLFAAIITFSAIRFAVKPADSEHPYGHGKMEDIAGTIQGVLIFIAGVLIIYFSTRRIIEGSSVELVQSGLIVMLVSIVASVFLSRHLLKVSRATGSIALEANAKNITADAYSAVAVIVGLVIVQFTRFYIVDPIIAIGVAIYILKIAVDTMRKPISGLLDATLPPSDKTAIEARLRKHSHEVVSYHELRTRRSGSQYYIDLHLIMSKDITLEDAHQICDRIETEIKDELCNANVTIHVEPCDEKCEQCSVLCPRRQSK